MILSIHPMQWEAVPELHDAPDLDLSDMACMDEVRAVLARHGKLARFAMHLVHKHIELADGEVLVERPDAVSRTQHVTVERLADVPRARPTTWIFGPGSETAVYCACETITEGLGCLWHSELTITIMEKETLLKEIAEKERARIQKRYDNLHKGEISRDDGGRSR